MARRLAALIPYYAYDDLRFFRSDGAPDEVAARRRVGFARLSDLYRERYARTAASLGASPLRVFVAVKLPILGKPVAIACAVAFAVSAGLYLPTLFAGNGLVPTLTTEAVTLSAGADRRVIGAWALAQAAVPLVVYAAAVLLTARRSAA